MTRKVAPNPERTLIQPKEWPTELLTCLEGHPALSAEDRAVLHAQLEHFSGPAPPTQPPDPSQPLIVRTEQELTQTAARLSQEPVLVIDLETSALKPDQGEVVGVGLAGADFTVYFPTAHRLEGSHELLPDQLPLAEIVDVLGLERLDLVAHNAKFELKWLRRHAGIEPHFIWDTMLAGQLLHSDLSADLEQMAMRELDVPAWALSTNDLKRIQYLSIERVARYCAKDAWYTLQLMRRQKTCLV